MFGDKREEGDKASYFKGAYKLIKVKVKVPVTDPKVQRVGRGITLLFLDRGARRGWVVSITPLYPRERPGIYCTGGRVDPTAGLDVCEKSRPPP
jgi:hypothetical protein